MLARVRNFIRQFGGQTPGDHSVLCRARDLGAEKSFYQWFDVRGPSIEAAETALRNALTTEGADLEEIEEWHQGATPFAPDLQATSTSGRVYYRDEDQARQEDERLDV